MREGLEREICYTRGTFDSGVAHDNSKYVIEEIVHVGQLEEC